LKISSADRVRQSLLSHDHEDTIIEFPEGTRSAKDAANAVGCCVAQIVKSMIFRSDDQSDDQSDDRPVLVLTSGSNWVDEAKVSKLLNTKIKPADGRWVRDVTGFAIGGVAPIGHIVAPVILIDEDLVPFPRIWAAAGSPMKVFSTSPSRLIEMTNGLIADIKKE
jgi:prolyl-tRNA editing enzyme YbaK/EbsC (Cys-tRNA(Pro) deacylase)